MTSTGTGFAALRMYDLPEIRAAVDGLWASINERVPGSPSALTWDGDLVAQWLDPDLVLGQSCGWPMVTMLAGRVTVVGAFRYHDLEPAPGPVYRSVVVAADDKPLASFEGSVAAVNAFHSLSGWVSLAHAVAAHAGGAPFFADTVVTGAHVESLARIRDGSVDLAAIDGVTYRLLERHRPSAVEDLAVVAMGPLIPTLPLITAADDPEPLRAAIASALADPATEAIRAELSIEGFHSLDESDYAPVRDMGPVARAVIPPVGE